jgi:hypothetical protein
MRVLLLLLAAVSAGAKDFYLFTSFRGNGETGVYFALSADGYAWAALNGNKPWIAPRHEGMLMRDPFLTRGPDGVYHLLWTWGWTRGAKGEGLKIGYSSSKDLVEWSAQRAIPVLPDEPEARNAWAPEMYFDRKNRQWTIYWSTTIPNRFPATEKDGDSGYNHRIYAMTTGDFQTFSPARLFFDPGYSAIDATILEARGKFYMIFKDERRTPLMKSLRLAVSDKLEGPYTGVTEPFTRDWVEGPSAIRIGGEYLVYLDHYRRPQHYGAVRSRNLKTWEDVSDQVRFPDDHRHGTVIRISKDEASRLAARQP